MKPYEIDFDNAINIVNFHLSEVECILEQTANREMTINEIEEGLKHLIEGFKPYLAMILSVGITDISNDSVCISIKSIFALFKKAISNRVFEIREEGRELFDIQYLLEGDEWDGIRNYFDNLNEKEKSPNEQNIDEMSNEINRTVEIMKIFNKLKMTEVP